MTASFQNPPGALPPETPHAHRPAQLQQVVAVAQAAPVPLSPVQVTAGVIRAAMANGSGAPEEIAQAEQDAGIIFDPRRAQEIWDAGYEQARAEDKAELAERGEQLAVMTDFKHRFDLVMRAIEGRPDNDTMLVREILAAAHDTAPYADVPMTLAWTRSVDVPEQGAEDQRAVVDCVTAHGGRGHLVLTREERQALASLLDAEIVRDIHAPCPHSKACGLTDDEIDAAYPKLFGWSRVFIVGLDEPGRWYCTPACVFRALARAGEKLAAADDQGAPVDPHQQAPDPRYGGDPLAYGPTGIPCGCGKDAHSNLVPCRPDPAEGDEGARCVRCGCTDNRACEGGCHWAPNRQMVDLCSRCVTPEELVYAVNSLTEQEGGR